jgi:hypothetical protein
MNKDPEGAPLFFRDLCERGGGFDFLRDSSPEDRSSRSSTYVPNYRGNDLSIHPCLLL